MMNRFTIVAVWMLLISVSRLPSVYGDEKRNPAQNAALQYWQALVYIPADPRLTQWEVASDSPLTVSTEDAEFLLNDSGIGDVVRWSLDDLRRGAKRPYCEWGISILETGWNTPAHHVQRTRTATGLLVLSARLEYSRGNWNAAVDDLNTAWVFLRHLTHDVMSASRHAHYYLVKNSIAPLAASWVPTLEQSAADRLNHYLQHLPSVPPLSELVQVERDLWLQQIELNGLPWLNEQLENLAKQQKATDSSESLNAGVNSKDNLLSLMKETRQQYNEATRIASLPLDQFMLAMPEFQKSLSRANPLTRLTIGRSWSTEDRVRTWKYQEAKSITRLAMFEAAIALRLQGREGFDRIPDSFGDGRPFTYSPSENGYTLTSALTIDGERFSMKFGKEAVPAPETKSQLLIYDPDADADAEIQAALEVAHRDNKRVLLQWGFNGCIPCYALHRVFEEHQGLAELLRTSFIHLPVDVINQENHTLFKKYGVQMPGVPHLTVLNADGKAVANVKPAEHFYVNGNLDASLIQAFLEKWSRRR